MDPTKQINALLPNTDRHVKRTVTIDSIEYALASAHELNVTTAARLDYICRRFRQDGADLLDKCDEVELSQIETNVRLIVKAILRAPEDVLDRLTCLDEMQIVAAFTQSSVEDAMVGMKPRKKGGRRG